MSVPPGTLTDEWRGQVLDFYGSLFGWREMDALRLPDRLTIAVGNSYINVRERPDAATYNGYEHFGVAVDSPDTARAIWAEAKNSTLGVELDSPDPPRATANGFISFHLRYLLPLSVEVQYFPSGP